MRKAHYLRCARVLLGSYRSGEASDPEIYATQLLSVFSRYPDWVSEHVAKELPSKLQWLPTAKEIRDACAELYAPFLFASEWDKRSAEQLAERKRQESAPRPKQSYEEFRVEMAARGMPIDRHRDVKVETVEAVKARLGITDAQWDAIPSLPEKVADRCPDRVDERSSNS